MAPKELSELTVFNRRKAHLLGQITRIRNSLENVESPLNQVEKRAKLASLSEVKAKIDKLDRKLRGARMKSSWISRPVWTRWKWTR
ncbi:hypothetical protein TNCV_1103021 [Trichonephila clavipes]|nr:hypothetical protein TNCV_1103021 [Trichonephila clavipes]